MSISILHFINPYPSQDRYDQQIQEITINSILKASKKKPTSLNLKLGAVTAKSDKYNHPAFLPLPGLKRSVLEIVSLKDGKPFPLIADIFQSGLSDMADYYIYSNMDIGLQPHFYAFVVDRINEGYDGFIINRRRIPNNYIDKSLEAIYAAKGKPHPGFDCFICSRKIAEKLILDEICVGIPFVGVSLAHNIFAFAHKPKLFDQEFLTFHIGLEIFPERNKILYWHNRHTFFSKIKPKLWKNLDIRNIPYFEKGIFKYLYWLRNPSLFIWMNIKLELRRKFLGY